jgi:hypothetical protein
MSLRELRRSMAEAKRQDRGFPRRPRILDYLGAGGMDESEARKYAQEMVRYTREMTEPQLEGPAPDPDTVREHSETLRGQQHS